jgi:hypothetical protein
MDIVKSGVSSVRSNSKVAKNVLVCWLIFVLLPIDSLLKVRVQSQVVSPLRQLLNNDVGKVLLTFVFYLLVESGDALLLVLFITALNKL